MSIESDACAALLASPAVLALVGHHGGQHVYIDEVPEDVQAPYVVYSKPDEQIERGLDGSVHLRRARLEFQCVGGTRPLSIQLRNAVIAALEVAGQPPDASSAGFDEDSSVPVEVVPVDWFA
jgi:Protein of unknown function (DUF3168)